MLSGDDLTKITPRRFEILKKLVPGTGVAARFEDDTLTVGVTTLPDRRMIAVLNWTDQPETRSITLPPGDWDLTDHWTGESLGKHAGTYALPALGGRSARLIEARPAGR
jgi:alpha-galactosidase